MKSWARLQDPDVEFHKYGRDALEVNGIIHYVPFIEINNTNIAILFALTWKFNNDKYE